MGTSSGCYWIFLISITLGCVTPVKEDVKFDGFPEAFRAIQIVKIQSPNGGESLLANLIKERSQSYVVTFLHPLAQSPLLTLSYRNGVSSEKHLYEKLPADIHGEEILRSMRNLYEHKVFGGDGNSLTYEDNFVTYTLSELKNFGTDGKPCWFPNEIEIKPKSGDLVTRVQVQTKELECK